MRETQRQAEMARERQEFERIKLMQQKQFMSPYEEMRSKYLKSTLSQDGKKKGGKQDFSYDSEDDSPTLRD